MSGNYGRLLPRTFFDRPVLEVAPDLLGQIVLHNSTEGPVAVQLTEVEAYDGEQDPGSHAFRGRTARNAVMFGPPGHVYVYFTYGMHWCMNLVCGEPGRASAVLLRAGRVVQGMGLARSRRRTSRSSDDLARGPARLTTALGITGRLDGADACSRASALQVLHGTPYDAARVEQGPRTGVGGDGAWQPWRFWVSGEPTVSPHRPHSKRRSDTAVAPLRRRQPLR